MKRLIISLFFALSGFFSWGQGYFQLDHTRKDRQFKFEEGVFFRFQVKNDPGTYGAYLHGIGADFLEISYTDSLIDDDFADCAASQRLYVKDLAAIMDPRTSGWRRFRRLAAGMLATGASAYIGITSARAITDQVEPSMSAHMAAAGILGAAFVLRYGGRDELRLGKSWTLSLHTHPPFSVPFISQHP